MTASGMHNLEPPNPLLPMTSGLAGHVLADILAEYGFTSGHDYEIDELVEELRRRGVTFSLEGSYKERVELGVRWPDGSVSSPARMRPDCTQVQRTIRTFVSPWSVVPR